MNATNAKTAKITAALVACLCVFGFVASAKAESRLEQIQVQPVLQVDCAAPRIPTQYEIGQLFDAPNQGQAFELRLKLRRTATNACRFGADRVLFVRHESDTREDTMRYLVLND